MTLFVCAISLFAIWFACGLIELKESEEIGSRTQIGLSFLGGVVLPFVGASTLVLRLAISYFFK